VNELPLPTLADVQDAHEVIRPHIFRTPLVRSHRLGEMCGCELYFKLENVQFTGSFKDRGVSNKLAKLGAQELKKGVITASAGNHAQAVAAHCGRMNIPATIVMPLGTPLIKVVSTQGYGAEVILHGDTYDDACDHAKELAHTKDLTFIPAFNDPHVVAGQGTVALEIMEEMPDGPDVLICPVGGGGLIGGMALTFKHIRPQTHIVGVQSQAVPGMITALNTGKIVRVDAASSLADGIAVRQVGELTLALAQRYVDEWTAVQEEQIANAVLLLLENEKTVAEGAGAAPVAALINRQVSSTDGKKVVCVISGGNIDVNILDRIIVRGLALDGRVFHFTLELPDKPGQLAGVLEVIKSLQANILEIDHHREFNYAPFGNVYIEITLETRGHQHIAVIKDRLREKGYRLIRQHLGSREEIMDYRG
jgi:threonine dehydratase